MVPLIDLRDDWSTLAATVDAALRTSGFLLLAGHGIDPVLPGAVRREAKAPHASTSGSLGWTPPGAEATAHANGRETPPDLKEAFFVAEDGRLVMGADGPALAVNRAVPEAPGLVAVALEYLAQVDLAAHALLALLAHVLGDTGEIRSCTDDAASVLGLNWYPPAARTGPAAPGQFRIGPHTDFGTVTLLDREPGLGGLQIQALDGTWVDAPHVSGALVVNVGDLLARWTGDRWRSTPHRVLPPPAGAPGEELLSLVYFVEANLDATIRTLPGGPTTYAPINAGEHLRGQLAAITV
jgi:isopenicillin N synthase-like dioxygenase